MEQLIYINKFIIIIIIINNWQHGRMVKALDYYYLILIDNDIRISLVGQDMWFSPTRPEFKSRMRNKYINNHILLNIILLFIIKLFNYRLTQYFLM